MRDTLRNNLRYTRFMYPTISSIVIVTARSYCTILSRLLYYYIQDQGNITTRMHYRIDDTQAELPRSVHVTPRSVTSDHHTNI